MDSTRGFYPLNRGSNPCGQTNFRRKNNGINGINGINLIIIVTLVTLVTYLMCIILLNDKATIWIDNRKHNIKKLLAKDDCYFDTIVEYNCWNASGFIISI